MTDRQGLQSLQLVLSGVDFEVLRSQVNNDPRKHTKLELVMLCDFVSVSGSFRAKPEESTNPNQDANELVSASYARPFGLYFDFG